VSALALTSPGDIAQQQNTHTHTDRENVEKKKSRKDALTMMVSLSLFFLFAPFDMATTNNSVLWLLLLGTTIKWSMSLFFPKETREYQ
jgi:hypothetical protein